MEQEKKRINLTIIFLRQKEKRTQIVNKHIKFGKRAIRVTDKHTPENGTGLEVKKKIRKIYRWQRNVFNVPCLYKTEKYNKTRSEINREKK